jgi:hypothetical protein
MAVSELRMRVWRVHDTGLVAVPPRFRRLGGLVRHLQGRGDAWPAEVVLKLDDERLRVEAATGAVGTWSVAEVSATIVSLGPPLTFTLEIPGAVHLLAAPADAATEALLARLSLPTDR